MRKGIVVVAKYCKYHTFVCEVPTSMTIATGVESRPVSQVDFFVSHSGPDSHKDAVVIGSRNGAFHVIM